jgi:hypothetical protein
MAPSLTSTHKETRRRSINSSASESTELLRRQQVSSLFFLTCFTLEWWVVLLHSSFDFR